jgi:hypothetical protein
MKARKENTNDSDETQRMEKGSEPTDNEHGYTENNGSHNVIVVLMIGSLI